MDKFSCPIEDCSKTYKCKSNLNRHLQAIHAENKRFQCETCEKVLSSSQNLKEHKLLHSKILPFVCKEIGCGKRFRHGSQFSAHKRIHNFTNNLMNSSQKSFNCSVLNEKLADVLQSTNETVENFDGCFGFKLPKIKGRQEFKLPSI